MAKKTKKPKQADTKTVTVRKALKFKLTQEEITAKQAESLKLEERIEAVNENVKEYKAKKKAEIKDVVKARTDIRHMLKAGVEERTVKCTEKFDYVNGTVTTLWDGKKFDSRKLKDSERQTAMFKTVASPSQIDASKPLTSPISEVIASETNRKTKVDMSTRAEA